MDSRNRRTRKLRKTSRNQTLLCNIPILAPASSSLSKADRNEIGDDFYHWVNKKWLKSISIPPFENDFGVSEEVERCIYSSSKQILLDIKTKDSKFLNPFEKTLKTLSESCLHSASQHNSVDSLKKILAKLECIETKEDVVSAFGKLAMRRLKSVFNYNYHITPDNTVHIFLNPNVPSINSDFYYSAEIMSKYRTFLHVLEEHFNIPFTSILEFEQSLVFRLDSEWNDTKFKLSGYKLKKKFPKFPWDSWFQDLPNWKTMSFYICSSKWIRTLGRLLEEIPIVYWKVYLSKIYVLELMEYLPPPFDEMYYTFFGRRLQGQKVKMPQQELLVNIVYDFFPDQFSELFWEHSGNKELLETAPAFCESIRKATVEKLKSLDWLHTKTKEYAVKKVESMKVEVVKPKHWETQFPPLELNDSNLLENILALGEWNNYLLFSRIGSKRIYWEEGIYRVNAYYFNENNQIMIPFGTMIPPFYTNGKNLAWDYGALGCIIGHEMCHGFDKDGHLYDVNGVKRNWWLRSDSAAYNRKTKQLVELFNTQKIGSKQINGEKTLSENFADLCGLSISLEAFKNYLKVQGIEGDAKQRKMRDFFTAFALSWRTKYREEKLRTSLVADVHAPPFLRVNMIVCQFDEWYDAFDIPEDSQLYVKKEDRIHII